MAHRPHAAESPPLTLKNEPVFRRRVTSPEAPKAKTAWTVADSQTEYNIENWGAGYFTVNETGHLCVTPYGKDGPIIDMMDVIEDLHERGIGFPCVIRFQDVLRSRVVMLNETFRAAIKEHGFSGHYFGVFPIKVNQMREVVEEILDAGEPYAYGIEAGSKPELFPAIALNTHPDALTICNGYKDEDYMRLALIGRKLGRKAIVVIEKLSEIPLVLRVADELGVEPLLGFRARLATKGAGKWESSSGDFAKFGLTVPEIVQGLRLLREAGKLHTLKLFHFHVGSQLTDIHTIKDAVREGARIYAKLRKMGCDIEYFDIGGGLGVDYVGSKTTNNSSTNYSLEEYARDVVYNLKQICDQEDVPEPNLVSESGRAVTAHHSCIVMNVFGAIEMGVEKEPSDIIVGDDEFGNDLVREMRDIVHGLTEENVLETFHDAESKRDDALQAFRLGFLGLEERAAVENMYWDLMKSLVRVTRDMKHVPEDLRDLGTELADQYLANFSLFQSALDHWAFDQLFPIAPIHRLDEKPGRGATLVDITCDSDGKIDRFVDIEGERQTLPLHKLRKDEPYFIGMFLTGAYQDIMGDMHNLFGRTNEVHVFSDDDDPEDFYIETVIKGDIVSDVLGRVQYEPKDLVKKVKAAVDLRIKDGSMKPKEGVALVDFLDAQMSAYTYLIATSADGLERLSGAQMEAMRQGSAGK